MKCRIPNQYGGGSRQDMMNKLTNLQNEMTEKQEELKNKEYSANAGGGAVSVTVNGDHKVVSISVKPEVVDPEDTEMLCDMIVAAVNEAVDASKKDYEETMAALTGGLNIPGLNGLI